MLILKRALLIVDQCSTNKCLVRIQGEIVATFPALGLQKQAIMADFLLFLLLSLEERSGIRIFRCV